MTGLALCLALAAMLVATILGAIVTPARFFRRLAPTSSRSPSITREIAHCSSIRCCPPRDSTRSPASGVVAMPSQSLRHSLK
jgi:hypothetical protein